MNEFFPAKAETDKESPLTKLFGNRFFVDQCPLELLSEFLLICTSKIIIAGEEQSEIFPDLEYRFDIDDICYKPVYKLALKLFAFYDHVTGDRVVPAIEKQFTNQNKEKIDCIDSTDYNPNVLLEVLRSVYKGFLGAGANRDWCAQSFLPVSKSLLAGESIWSGTNARHADIEDGWNSVELHISHNKHAFYARGGELLYLQLLLALNQKEEDVDRVFRKPGRYDSLRFTSEELNPKKLREKMNQCFSSLFKGKVPQFFDDFADSLSISESNDDSETSNATMGKTPSATWEYGYLFAVELSRLFRSSFDIIDMLKHLENACVLQVIRTVLWASADALNEERPFLPVISSKCDDIVLKYVSNESFSHCQRMVKKAVAENAKAQYENTAKYGHKLIQKLGKSVGFIQPPKGGLEHFVLSKDLIVLLVSTTYEPGQMQRFDLFLNELKVRYGIVIDSDGFNQANIQNGKMQHIGGTRMTEWIVNLLRECDFFVELSDSISLIKNTNIAER